MLPSMHRLHSPAASKHFSVMTMTLHDQSTLPFFMRLHRVSAVHEMSTGVLPEVEQLPAVVLYKTDCLV